MSGRSYRPSGPPGTSRVPWLSRTKANCNHQWAVEIFQDDGDSVQRCTFCGATRVVTPE